jgi:hypothetical protein
MAMEFVFHGAGIGGQEYHAVICVRDMSPKQSGSQIAANEERAQELAIWLKAYLTRPTSALLKEYL